METDIGSSLIRAKYSKELKEKEDKFLEEKKILERKLQQSENKLKLQLESLNNTFPEKIFICEDETGCNIWEGFFKKQNIENIAIFSSKGCTVNNVEIWISGNIKSNDTYNPKVFRSVDRDGYTNDQIEFLEERLKDRNGKKLGINGYQIKFLPVNELENFAVLSDEFFTEVLIKANKDRLEDHFLQTVSENIKQFTKFDSPLFEFNKATKIANRMKREAEKEILKYFPGKEIKKLKTNFDTNRFLRNLNLTRFPDELKEYLNEIKLFFET